MLNIRCSNFVKRAVSSVTTLFGQPTKMPLLVEKYNYYLPTQSVNYWSLRRFEVLPLRSFSAQAEQQTIFDVDSDDGFDELILNSEKPVIACFHADWYFKIKSEYQNFEKSEFQNNIRISESEFLKNQNFKTNQNFRETRISENQNFRKSEFLKNQNFSKIRISEQFQNIIRISEQFLFLRCGPCQSFAPRLEAKVTGQGGKILLAKINVEGGASSLAEQFEVTSIPTIVCFKNGEFFDRIEGAVEDSDLDDLLEDLLMSGEEGEEEGGEGGGESVRE
ncbi:unnamed protein product [Meloidogyne enterolobii]|uniref:Uncharacterized protein n=1 Tax=Meloidogyne enterolobii TaxID=390850 RepID=A0ACB0ZDV0_MELEN